jgi:hypothetical protein
MSTKKAKATTSTEIPADIADFAQKSVDQAQAAFEKANEVAHGNVQMLDAAASAYKNRFTDIQLKAMEFAQQNVNASFGFARQFFSAKEPTEAFTLHQGFMKDQAEALQRQVTELNELSMVIKPVQDTVTKSFSGLSKTFSAE